MRRHQNEGLIIILVIAKPCAWKEVEWLTRIQVCPRNGRPVWGNGGSHVDEDLATISEEVAAIVSANRNVSRYLRE